MQLLRPFRTIVSEQQWLAAAREHTLVAAQEPVVELRPLAELPASGVYGAVVPGTLAFDRSCRLYVCDSSTANVLRYRWGGERRRLDELEPLDSFADEAPLAGDFVQPARSPLAPPLAVTVVAGDQLVLVEGGTGQVSIFDLRERRLVSSLLLAPGRYDLSARGGEALLVRAGSAQVLSLDETGRLSVFGELPAADVGAPLRIQASRVGVFVLVQGGTPQARVVALGATLTGEGLTGAAIPAPNAADLGSVEDGESVTLAAITGPGVALPATLMRFALQPQASGALRVVPLPHQSAARYDGRGVAGAPDGRFVYTTQRGLEHAVQPRARLERRGSVRCRLEAEHFGNRWGRVLLEASVPVGTGISIRFRSGDDPEELERQPLGDPPRVPFRRPTGRDLPWTDPGGWEVYEAPLPAVGRYLDVHLELTGTGSRTPRLRRLRVELENHALLSFLPKVFARADDAAGFFDRYLALFDGPLYELALRSWLRHVIVDPASTPSELLAWLGSFVGLALDERMPVAVRRRLIADAAFLFRFRGTLQGLSRFLEIYIGRPPVLLEQFRLRGLSRGERAAGEFVSSSVLGEGFRVGGTIDESADSEPVPSADVAALYAAQAHRFSVLIPSRSSAEQLDVIRSILDQHRPAHTTYDLCTVDGGMRVGIGLYPGLSTLVGPSSGFEPMQVGHSVLGDDNVVGRPRHALSVGAAIVGRDTRLS